MHLNSGIQAALAAQLNAILTTLSSPSNNNLPFACPRLNALKNTIIPGYLREGQLNSNQAAQLIQLAQNIQTALCCTVLSSGNGIGALSESSLLPSPSASSLNLTQSQQHSQQPQQQQQLVQLYNPNQVVACLNNVLNS